MKLLKFANRPSVGSILLSFLFAASALSEDARRVTVLYDAFGTPSALQKDWGYSSFVEYGGRRILFDTGNNARIFEHNVRAARVDLSRLDAVVISHRHGDHTTGLSYLLSANPGVKIYVPVEGAFFKARIPAKFFARAENLPTGMHYFDGKTPESVVTGSPWEGANFEAVAETMEIFPGFLVLVTQSQKPGTLEMNELSLAMRTPKGLAIIVGCSHPGVEKILENAAKIDPKLYTVTGGFHLVTAPDEEVRRVAGLLHDSLKLDRVAPGHCTSELGFAVFRERFQDHFDAAGLGTALPLP